MQYQLSAFDLHFLIKELKESLIDARVDKIYQPEKKDFLFTFHVPSKGKFMFKLMLPSVMYFTEFKEEMPTHPPHFCLFLRKHLSGSFLRDIRQCGFERVAEFIFENKNGKKHLLIEFFSRGNIILTEDDYTIRNLLEIQAWKDRKLRGNVKYEFPKRKYNPLEMGFDEFSECIEESDKEAIVKTLALDLGLGGRYAEELCYRAGVDKNKYYVQDEDKNKLFSELEKFRHEPLAPNVVYDNEQPKAILPINVQTVEGEKKEFNSFNEALDNVLAGEMIETEKEKKLAPFEKKKRKLELQIKQQEEQIEKMQKEAELNQKKGELVYNNYHILEPMFNELRDIIKKHPQKEIKEKLQDHKVIKDINFKDKQVTVELE